MKIKLLICILFVFIANVYAQRYDHNWIIGQRLGNNENILNRKNLIHFNDNTIGYIKSITSKNSLVSAYNLTASDSIGNLIFYFNGLKFFNRKNKVMENGDSIGAFLNKTNWEIENNVFGCLHEDDYKDRIFDYTQKFIPFPGHDNQYLVFFTTFSKKLDLFFYKRLAYVRIDMDLDDGFGAVMEKKKQILDGLVEGIGLVKHANGEDWWLVTAGLLTNVYYIYLIDKNGITGPKKIEVEPEFRFYPYVKNTPVSDSHFNMFSPDGTTYVRIQISKGLFLYHFDRCTGEMSFLRKINTVKPIKWLAFSPDSRFIYFNNNWNLYQIDLNSPTDNYTLISPLGSQVKLQLGPDGRIYFSYERTKYLGYINKPNNKGLSCDVRSFAIKTPEYKNLMLPQYPNYRLSAINGVNCPELDTIYQPYGERIKFNMEDKEYYNSDRYRILIDSSWLNIYKISE